MVLLPQKGVVGHDAGHEARHPAGAQQAVDDEGLGDVGVEGAAQDPPGQGAGATGPLVALEGRLAQVVRAQPAGREVEGQAQQPREPGRRTAAAVAGATGRGGRGGRGGGEGVDDGTQDVQQLGGVGGPAHGAQETRRRPDVVGREHLLRQEGRHVGRARQRRQREAGARHGPVAGRRRRRGRGRRGAGVGAVEVGVVVVVFGRRRRGGGVGHGDALGQRRDGHAAAGEAQQDQTAEGLEQLEDDDDAPADGVAAALGGHLGEQLRAAEALQQQRDAAVAGVAGGPVAGVAGQQGAAAAAAGHAGGGHAGQTGDGAGEQRVVEERQQLQGRVQRLGRELGVAERRRRRDHVRQRPQPGLELRDRPGVVPHEASVHGHVFGRPPPQRPERREQALAAGAGGAAVPPRAAAAVVVVVVVGRRRRRRRCREGRGRREGHGGALRARRARRRTAVGRGTYCGRRGGRGDAVVGSD